MTSWLDGCWKVIFDGLWAWSLSVDILECLWLLLSGNYRSNSHIELGSLLVHLFKVKSGVSFSVYRFSWRTRLHSAECFILSYFSYSPLDYHTLLTNTQIIEHIIWYSQPSINSSGCETCGFHLDNISESSKIESFLVWHVSGCQKSSSHILIELRVCNSPTDWGEHSSWLFAVHDKTPSFFSVVVTNANASRTRTKTCHTIVVSVKSESGVVIEWRC